MARFLDLPLEVRLMIYKHLLVPREVLSYQYKTGLAHYQNGYLGTAIVSASKEIWRETESILYQKNTFILPVSPPAM